MSYNLFLFLFKKMKKKIYIFFSKKKKRTTPATPTEPRGWPKSPPFDAISTRTGVKLWIVELSLVCNHEYDSKSVAIHGRWID
jgi:hypothetical protein